MSRRYQVPEAIDLSKYQERGSEPRYKNYFRQDESAGALAGRSVQGRSQRDGAQLPPTSNTGGKSAGLGVGAETSSSCRERTTRTVQLLVGNKIKELTLRAGWGDDLAHVDTVSFTIHESTMDKVARRTCLSNEDFALEMSVILKRLVGFGITGKRPAGLNFYEETWLLGDGYGSVSCGGQRNTILVQLTGTGCACARDDWEMRLYRWLSEEAERPRITRIDLAFDDLDGTIYTPDQALEDAIAGLYSAGGRRPHIEQRGNWLYPDGSGRTFYAGKRENGKFCRVYEKGREQGDPNHPWVRVEVELKSKDRIIPLDALIDAGAYFAGCYPAFQRFKGLKTPKVVKTQQQEMLISYDHLKHYAALQVGRLVNYMRDVARLTAEQVVEVLARPDGSYPERLRLSKLHSDFIDDAMYLHNGHRETFDGYGLAH